MNNPKLRAVPPSNREAEAVVLGGLIVDDEVRGKLLSDLVPQHFYDLRHREVFESIKATLARGLAITELTVASELERRGKLAVPAKPFIAGLLDAVGFPREAFAAADLLREAHLGRQALETIPDIERASLNGVGLQRLALVRDTLSALLEDDSQQGITFEPVDLATLLSAPPEPLEFVYEPYMPKGYRVWAFGAASSGKSMWAAWVASQLTRRGQSVVYVSQENPLVEHLRRFRRLRPDPGHLRLLHDAGIDLAQASHVAALVEVAWGAALVILDTISACWSGDENDNAAIAQLDRTALQPLVNQTGATVLVLDHSGHAQPFVKREGVSKGRGASSKGQKADVVLTFDARTDHEILLKCPKLRGSVEPAPTLVRVVDTPDEGEGEGLDIETVGTTEEVEVDALADAMVDVILSADKPLSTKEMKDRVKGLREGFGSAERQKQAMEFLKAEQPPRVRANEELIQTSGGKHKAVVWRPAGGELV